MQVDSFRLRASAGLLLAGAILAASASVAIADRKKQAPPPKLSGISLGQFTHLVWSPETNSFESNGPVLLTLSQFGAGEAASLEADDASCTPEGLITVKGKLRLTRPEGWITGNGMVFDTRSQSGSVHAAEAVAMGVRVKGKLIEMTSGQALAAHESSFTTCSLAHPHYRITAGRMRVRRNGQVSADRVALFLGGAPVIAFPGFTKTFNRQVRSPFPLPGFSAETGPRVRIKEDLAASPGAAATLDLQLSLRTSPEGVLAYSTDIGTRRPGASPPELPDYTFNEPLRGVLEKHPLLGSGDVETGDGTRRIILYSRASLGSYVYNRNRRDLRISRLPEVGVRFENLVGGIEPAATTPGGTSKPGADSPFAGLKGWHLDGEISGSYVKERPTNTETSRFSARGDLAGPAIELSRTTVIRYAAAAQGSLYGNGNAYTLLAPEAEASWFVTPELVLGSSYRYVHAIGRTPFLFDDRDVRHEVGTRLGFLNRGWGFDLGVRWDMERKRAYDTQVTAKRRYDCLEIGVRYEQRRQSISMLLNLLPGDQSHASTAH